MELKLSNEEVREVLLAYANNLIPGAFNTVEAPSYYAITGAVFSFHVAQDEAQ